jgi:sulfotransferase
MLDPKNRKTLYFMAGLPRSGSTLLSSLLNQNPRFYSGPSSPVTGLMMLLQDQILNDELYRAFPKPAQASELVASVIQHYYSDVDKPVIFDKNRSWVNRLGFISGFFGVEPRVLIPVRDTAEILTSFITMHRRNPYEVGGRINFLDEMLVKSNIPLTDDNRCQFLASQAGILGQSYAGIQQALMEGRQRQLHFIEYNDLMNNPAETMRRIYEFLDEPYFEHDFDQITNIHRENDAEIYGFADMHQVRGELKKTSADPRDILSPEILKSCEGTEFWRNLSPLDAVPEPVNTPIMPTAGGGFFGSTEAADSQIIGG